MVSSPSFVYSFILFHVIFFTSTGERDIPEIIDVYVASIEDGLFKWKIPCFPVIEVEFRCAWERRANMRCTSHCTITIHSENYFAMWNFQEDTTIPENNDQEQLDSIPKKPKCKLNTYSTS